MRASVVYLPTCQCANFSFLRANVPTCKICANFSTWQGNVPRRANFSIWHANVSKGAPIFQRFFERIFQYLNFSVVQVLQFFSCATFNNIWAILENLSREAKTLNLEICKISLRKCKINSGVVEVLKFLSNISKKIFSFCGTIKDLKVWINRLGRFQ